ncbi:MAG: hypothetical protein KDC98_05775 [Planctomycetes bacterium]|nr:hypothetical protein [Planctomycetota bacterium]
MELVLIVIFISVFAIVMSVATQRQKRLAAHTRMLEEALKNPAIDRATLENLTFQLTGRRPLRSQPTSGTAMAWILALGWLALFTGIGLLIAAENYSRSYGSDDLGIAAWVTGLIGFGLVTYPFALRELESRRAA